jgi:hypothetical protein
MQWPGREAQTSELKGRRKAALSHGTAFVLWWFLEVITGVMLSYWCATISCLMVVHTIAQYLQRYK